MHYDIKASGERIRSLRTQSGYTQEKIAHALNIDRSFYSRIESGKNGCSVDLLVQLADLFGVSLDYLVLGKYGEAALGETERMLVKNDIERLKLHLEKFGATL